MLHESEGDVLCKSTNKDVVAGNRFMMDRFHISMLLCIWRIRRRWERWTRFSERFPTSISR